MSPSERERLRLEAPRSARLDAIAEGVEAPDRAAALAASGCRDAQGRLSGRPVPAAESAARHAPSPARGVA